MKGRAGFMLLLLEKATILLMESSTSPRPRKTEQVKGKGKTMAIIIFYIKKVYKEFIPTDQTVNFTLNCDFLRWLYVNVQRYCPRLWWQKNWAVALWQHFASHFLVYHNLFGDKQHSPPTHPTHLTLVPWNVFLFSQLKIKLKDCRSDRVEII